MFDGPNFHHTTCVPAANEALGVQLSTMTRNITMVRSEGFEPPTF